MTDATPPPDAEQLLEAMLDRPLSAEELAQLRAHLASDPVAREQYLAQMSLHGLLQWRAEPEPNEPGGVPAELRPAAAPIAQAAVATGRPIAQHLARAWERWPRPIAFWSIVGGLTWFVWSLFFLALQSSPHSREHLTSREANNAPRVALLARTASARWEADSVAPLVGAALRRGHKLRLASGFAEIGFGQGATAIVEGPPEWEVLGERAVRLHYGRIVSRVKSTPDEPVRERFVVETPELRVVDLGTEFGVESHRDGQTRIYVFEGRVAARPLDSPPERAASQLSAGDSATYARSQLHVERQAPPPVRYVRSLDQLGTKIVTFIGADSGEGLDLEGEFAYAVNFHGPSIHVGDVLFQNAAEVTNLIADTPHVYAWEQPIDCGESAADQALAQVLNTMIFATAPDDVCVSLRVRPSARYRLQLLWYEQFRDNRTFGIELDGELVARSFRPALGAGRAVVHEFIARDDVFEIRLPGGVDPAIDPNPTLQALTLEEVVVEDAAQIATPDATALPSPEIRTTK